MASSGSMGLPSTAVDNNNASVDDKQGRNEGANFDRFASQNEEWIIRLQNLREDEEKMRREDCNGDGNIITNDPESAKGHTAATTILHATRLANLQCASAAYREMGCERKVITDVDRLYLNTQQMFDAESSHHESMLQSILRGVSPEPLNHQKVDEAALQSFLPDDDLCTDIEVDAFFEGYPECGRNMNKGIVYFSDNETDSDSEGEESCQSGRQKRRTESLKKIVAMTVDLVNAASDTVETQSNEHAPSNKQTKSQYYEDSRAQLPTPMDIQPEEQREQNKTRTTKPLSANNNHGNIDSSTSAAIKNLYSNHNAQDLPPPSSSVHKGQNTGAVIDLSRSTSNNDASNRSYNNGSRQGANAFENNRILSSNNNNRSNERNHNNIAPQRQITTNPYNRSSSQNNSQIINHGNSNNFYEQEDSNSRDAWRDHRNQTNPFLTAREVAIAEEKNPHRDPYRSRGGENRSKSQTSYNNPYGHDFQGRGSNHSDNMHEDNTAASTNGGPFIPDSLKRKFQRPKRGLGSASQSGASKVTNNRPLLRPPSINDNNTGSNGQRPSGSNSDGQADKQNTKQNKGDEEEDELPEELQHLDKELVKKIQNEIMESGDTVTFDDIAGLEDAKKTVREVVCWPMQRPDLFTGLRRAPNGLLLYGPPGTGKTLIGKAIAHESGATFFSISSSSLTSKWIGEGEKLVKTLFAVAAYNEPAVIFLDEIDSLLTQRKSTENEASRRIKTEFLVQLDGCGTSGQGRVLIIGATNRPQELDEAARRRFIKRLYIPLPVEADRKVLLGVLLKTNKHVLTESDINTLARDTEGFSGADLKALSTDAAMGPIRQLGAKAMDIGVDDVPPISYKHFKRSLKGMRPSVAQSDLRQYLEWDSEFGSKRCDDEEDDDDGDEKS